jgi:hypothetical protein
MNNYNQQKKLNFFLNLKRDIENLKYDNEILQTSIDSLNMELKKLKQNEHLLLKYPDLYGPLENLMDDDDEATTTSNVAADMQNQLNANKHRIYLLNNLNKKLENSIKKLNESTTTTNEISFVANEEKNYFKKQSLSNVSTPKAEAPTHDDTRLQALSRPVPLFKLENEIDQMNRNESAASQLGSQNRFWNQDESLVTPKKPLFGQSRVQNASAQQQEEKLDLDNDEEFDFLKEKHESDKNFLNRLNQINQTSELVVENNTDFSLMKNRRTSSRDHHATASPFLYSPSGSSMHSEANGNHSNLNSASNRYNVRSKSPQRPPSIPPAEKNMEVVVGKGRRVVNSATAVGNSARSNSSTSNNRKNSIPLPPTTRNASRSMFACENCSKKYSNGKDLDIHKMYCNV